jgi:hypothetical protein
MKFNAQSRTETNKITDFLAFYLGNAAKLERSKKFI